MQHIPRILALLCFVGCLCLLSSRAEAKTPKKHRIPTLSAKRLFRMKTIIVKGKPQRPQAFYVLQRSPLRYKRYKLRNTLIKKIISSVHKKPF